MGSEVAYRDDDFSQVDIQGLQQQLTDLDEAILLAQRVHVRKAELARIYMTLSDNLALQAPQALPPSTIRSYQQSQRVSEPSARPQHSFVEPTPNYIDHGQSVIKERDNTPFYEKWWFKATAIMLGIAALFTTIFLILRAVLMGLTSLAAGVGEWWSDGAGDTIIGIIGLIVIVIIVLALAGRGGGTVSGTFQGRWR